jgi:hypothetical protein
VKENEPEQPEFDAAFFRALPERQDVVDIVKSRNFLLPERVKVFRHTGRNLIKRLKCAPDLAVQVCWCLRSGMSARACAIRFSMSPNSITAIRDALRDRGELEAVAKRVDSILDRFIELASERIEEGILMGEVHPGQLPIPLMAAIDKRSQRDAGMVLGTERTQGDALLENLQAAWELARRKAAFDSESKSTDAQVVDVQTSDSVDRVSDTSADTVPSGGRVPDGRRTEAETAAAEAGPAAPGAAEAGGGDRDFAGRQNDGCTGPENIGT